MDDAEEVEVVVDAVDMADDEDEAEEDAVPAEEEDGDGGEEEEEEPVDVTAVEVQVENTGEDDQDSVVDAEDPTEHTENADDDDESQATEEDAASHSSAKNPKDSPSSGMKRTPTRSLNAQGSAKKVRTPSVKGLTIPFRTVKKAMKLDPDIPIVQNEAAIMTTMAAELFLKSLAKESHRNAKNRGRNTIRYEDVAEARTNNSALAFLETLLP